MLDQPERFATLLGAPGTFPVQDASSIDRAVWLTAIAGRAGINERAIAILSDCGIALSTGFLVSPDFTEADFQRIDDYVRARPNIVRTELTPRLAWAVLSVDRMMRQVPRHVSASPPADH